MRWLNFVGIFILLIIFSCSSTNLSGYDIGKITSSKVGWISINTYQILYFSEWDRERYYPLVKNGKKVPGKTAQTAFKLRDEAYSGIIARSDNIFYEEMKNIIKDILLQDVSDILIEEAINRNLNLLKIKKLVEKAFTDNNDAYLLVQYNYPDFKVKFDKTIEQVNSLIEESSTNVIINADIPNTNEIETPQTNIINTNVTKITN